MEFLGNISSALQASISTIGLSLGANISDAGEGLNNTMESTGSLLKDMVGNIGEGITKGFKKTSGVFIRISSVLRANILDASEGLGNITKDVGNSMPEISDKMETNIVDFANSGEGNDNLAKDFSYKRENFIRFVLRQITEAPVKVFRKVAKIGEGMTASVIDYSRINDSDLEGVSEEVNKEEVNGVESKGFVDGALNFFKNHRP
jgi:hypothetical protein